MDCEGWPQCETCGQPLLDFTTEGGSWECPNPECEENE